jgi:hypothetical protein
MDAVRVAPTAGIVAALATLVAIAAPYPIVGEASAVNAYYNAGAITPLAAGLLATVAIVVFAAGRAGRTDPPLAAGAALALGGFALAVSAIWAATVPVSVALQLGTVTAIRYHRLVLVVAAAGMPASAGWYARGLGLV